MAAYQIGAALAEEVVVESEYAITFLGPNAARVLSTPRMIGFMERVSRNLIYPMLDPGHDTVGTHVNVHHRKAAPMGSKVVFHAELVSVVGRRANFNVRAMMGKVVIGEGTHERAIIDIAKFTSVVSPQPK
jgi:predicted thioesterase